MEISIKRYRERVSLIDDVEFIMPQNPRVEKEEEATKIVLFALLSRKRRNERDKK